MNFEHEKSEILVGTLLVSLILGTSTQAGYFYDVDYPRRLQAAVLYSTSMRELGDILVQSTCKYKARGREYG